MPCSSGSFHLSAVLFPHWAPKSHFRPRLRAGLNRRPPAPTRMVESSDARFPPQATREKRVQKSKPKERVSRCYDIVPMCIEIMRISGGASWCRFFAARAGTAGASTFDGPDLKALLGDPLSLCNKGHLTEEAPFERKSILPGATVCGPCMAQ